MIWAAFALGLAGSLHCVGMCGPLAMAVPGMYGSSHHKWAGALLYHTGRALTYAVFGLIFGSVGRSFSLAGMQSWVSIVAGIVMIVMGLIPFFQQFFEKSLARMFSVIRLNTLRVKLLKSSKTPLVVLILGSLNGLLPCGLVYVALAGALGTGSPVQGALFMFVFGMGTLPALYVLSISGKYALSRKGLNAGKVIASVTVVVGLLFILRGADLGIPFLSPRHNALTVKEASIDMNEPLGSCCTSTKDRDDHRSDCH